MERAQLEYFVAIVEHGGFTHAARALRVAQPSLSRAIGKLERELGVELFHRVGRTAMLSNAGELMVGRARQVLGDMDAMRAAAQAVGNGTVGRVDVAATSSSALGPVAETIATLRMQHPGVTVSIWSAVAAAEVVTGVLQGRCEVGVCGSAERPTGRGLVAHPLRLEEFLVVAPPGTRLGDGHLITPEDLRGMSFVAPPAPTAVRTRIDRLAATVDLHIAAEVADRAAVLPLVLRGIGAALMPDGWLDLARRSGAEIYRFDPPEHITQWLVHRTGALTAPARAFVDLTRARAETTEIHSTPTDPDNRPNAA